VKHVNLGGLDVARIGLGAMGMSHAYTGAGTDDDESIRTIHRALDLGVTLIDSAEGYGPTPTRNSSAAPSMATATRLCWPPSSA
jgi:aryl-alcohol dehydrogenase-like predicted oxidoreductase